MSSGKKRPFCILRRQFLHFCFLKRFRPLWYRFHFCSLIVFFLYTSFVLSFSRQILYTDILRIISYYILSAGGCSPASPPSRYVFRAAQRKAPACSRLSYHRRSCVKPVFSARCAMRRRQSNAAGGAFRAWRFFHRMKPPPAGKPYGRTIQHRFPPIIAPV